MKVTKFSHLTGKMNTMELPITLKQIKEFEAGTYVQAVFPHLTGEEKDFLLFGTTNEERNFG